MISLKIRKYIANIHNFLAVFMFDHYYFVLFMPPSLDHIRSVVKEELNAFDQRIKSAMKSRVYLLDKISYYIVRTKGKQFRPLITILCAKLFGNVNEKSYNAAVLVELLHTATLVHDDVVDEAHQRRGFFSINALWKNKIAVLVGDYLLSRGLLTALENKHFDLLELLSTSVKEMSEGELMQLEKSRKLDISEADYFTIISQKTASLICSACTCGAISTMSPMNEKHLDLIKTFGTKLGIAFQIKDDLMDLSPDDTGKPKIHDIKEKKMTLPLISALSQASSSLRKDIIGRIRKDSEDEQNIQVVLDFIREYRGVEIASQKMNEYKDQCLELLKELPQNSINEALQELCHYVTVRTK